MYQKFIIIMHGKYILEMFLATVMATVAKQLLAGITKFMNFAFFCPLTVNCGHVTN